MIKILIIQEDEKVGSVDLQKAHLVLEVIKRRPVTVRVLKNYFGKNNILLSGDEIGDIIRKDCLNDFN